MALNGCDPIEPERKQSSLIVQRLQVAVLVFPFTQNMEDMYAMERGMLFGSSSIPGFCLICFDLRPFLIAPEKMRDKINNRRWQD